MPNISLPSKLLMPLMLVYLVFLDGAQAAPTATANTKPSSTVPNRNREDTRMSVGNADSSNKANSNLKWTSRSAWQAAPPLHAPTHISATGGVSHVIIHHTATPAGACRRNPSACAATVRAIQHNHQQQRGWDDIGYNFLIGGSDERAEIYEGRGFDVVGAHAVGYNARSVGIALIGDWTADLPPRPVLDKLQQLITYGMQMGHIQRNYALLGHRQVKATDCPGNRLYNALKEWPHFEQHAA
ncbi:peptidoglycan-recognition protein LB-like [Zeugodacus cucurbitae]|uniref:peptidoglycan-recognition protein LB-like n=1 Tax=Zeugodacus cucurbitae TaxID=28588 RepID=UPI0010A7474C|nr:peptidoglycan-recognition protein LB-like [Zeugodacus cucurbitae]